MSNSSASETATPTGTSTTPTTEVAPAAPPAVDVPSRNPLVTLRKRLGRIRRGFPRNPAQAKELIARMVFRRAQKSRFYSILYYTWFSPAFHWELCATARAVQAYHDRLEGGERSAVLRRNAHRLEKGLLMRPRRSVFAAKFIRETVEHFEKRVDEADGSSCAEDAELAWAAQVLRAYFDVVEDGHRAIRRSRPMFEAAMKRYKGSADDGQNRVPYLRDIQAPPPVSYDALHQLAIRRRSTRWFLPKAVPREITEKAVAVATQSPSACNRQPFELRVFDDLDLAPKVAKLAPGTRGFVDNIPAVAVLVGRLDNYFSESDRHLIYIDSSLAAMGFMYALESMGLSSCPLNWPDAEHLERRMGQLLGLEPYQRTIMLIAFGYPDETGKVAYSQKKGPDELCIYNRFGPHADAEINRVDDGSDPDIGGGG